jgi:hypothetical protein
MEIRYEVPAERSAGKCANDTPDRAGKSIGLVTGCELVHDAGPGLMARGFRAYYPNFRREKIVPRYIIQLPHGSDRSVCIRAIHAIESYGSHLLTNVEWGCKAGVHCGWAIVEVSNRQEATQLVPPGARRDAVIVELNRFTKEEMDSWVAHEDP